LTSQQVEVETLFPLVLPGRQAQREGPMRVRTQSAQAVREFIIEPSLAHVQRRVAGLLLEYRLYQIFWSSKLAEYSARIMHLEGSSRELTRISARHRLEYFKYIHSLSDKTIREIVASRLKLRTG
jgi:F0F1-type ATP synthase gamma subunit